MMISVYTTGWYTEESLVFLYISFRKCRVPSNMFRSDYWEIRPVSVGPFVLWHRHD